MVRWVKVKTIHAAITKFLGNGDWTNAATRMLGPVLNHTHRKYRYIRVVERWFFPIGQHGTLCKTGLLITKPCMAKGE